jgi:cell division protein FtsI/penicillin-binding protein 2
MRRSVGRRPRLLTAGLPVLVLTTGLVTACSSAPPDPALKKFAAGLPTGTWSGVPVTTTSGQPVSADTVTRLEGDLAGRKPTISVSKIKADGGTATATLTYRWPVAAGVTWEYNTSVRAKKDKKDNWQVYFEPKTLHPDLTDTDKISIRHTAAARGDILDGAGKPITSRQKIITVRVQPAEVTDVAGTVSVLNAALKSVKGDIGDIDLSGLPAQINAKGTAAIDVIPLRETTYNKIRATIHELGGLYFSESYRSLPPTPTFGKALIGRVGDVTKEVMDKSPGKYEIGDQVGLGGLQQQYDDTLGGSPGVSVVIPGKDASADKVLYKTDPRPGTTVKTTIDQQVQNAADAALAGQPRRSAIVAVRVSDGSTLAVANGPSGADLDLALNAQVAPGSTFKTVTALGVLENGTATVNTVVTCPKTYTAAGGTPIQNAHDLTAELGDTAQLHQDFAQSCNTAFAQLGAKLGPDGLAATAKTVGIGVPWDTGMPTFSGSVATGADPAEQAAAAFGQGRTLVSPATLAGVAAAVARGQWQQPKLVTDPAPKSPAPPGPQLKPESVAALKQMMREVVTDGTAKSIKGTPGTPIYGKTGTAEHGDADPNKTHSWFMGYRGDIAFAVFVEDGGLSTDAAVPIAGRFCAALP